MVTARREVVDCGRDNVTPKLHFLEDHFVPCMKRFRVGLGLLGGQGGKGHHHESNILNTSLGSIKQELERLKAVVNIHCVAALL